MEGFGKRLINIGIELLPYSFVFYLLGRWLEYKWQKGYGRFVKAAWYFCLGTLYLIDYIQINHVVMLICFIEAIDLFFGQLEINQDRKQKLES